MTNIILPRSVVEQALRALNPTASGNWTQTIALNAESAIHALRAALEQPQVEQEPVAWIEHEWSGSGLRHLHFERPAPTVRDEVVRPVWTPLYLHPQPPRQPLTKEEIAVIAAACGGLASDFVVSIASAIEVAHGIGGEK